VRSFEDSKEYDKVWYKLVEEIVDLEDQLNLEQISSDKDALTGITFLKQQLKSKRKLLKRLDEEGILFFQEMVNSQFPAL